MRARRAILAAALAAAAALASCGAPIDQRAPFVSDALAASAAVPRERLERGRALMLDKCATCHSIEAVNDWSEEEWADILPRMSRKAALNHAEAGDLEVYIMATLRVGRQGR